MGSWQSREVLAWTRHDGPGSPPPAAPRRLALALAGGLAVVFLGLMLTDTLCPEHRAWVDGLATASLATTVAAIVALVRGSSAAGPLAVLATLGGVAIGVLDAAHAPARGWTVALLFGALAVAALAMAAAGLRLRRWERRVRAAHVAGPAVSAATADQQPRPVDEPAPGPLARLSEQRDPAAPTAL